MATRATVLKILIGEDEADDDDDDVGVSSSTSSSTSNNSPFAGGQPQRRLRALGVRYLKDGVCHEGESPTDTRFQWHFMGGVGHRTHP